MEVEIRPENQRLFGEHPESWAWALVVDRLEAPLQGLASEAHAIQHAAPSPNESQGAIAQRFKSYSRLVELYTEGIAEWTGIDLVEACGGPGKEGDPGRIDERCGEILTACRRIIECEEELVSRPVHPSYTRAQSRTAGLSLKIICQLIWMVDSVREAIRAGKTPKLVVEFNSRTVGHDSVSDEQPAPVSFQAAPIFASHNAATTDAGKAFANMLAAILGLGIYFFIVTHFAGFLMFLIICGPVLLPVAFLFILWLTSP